MSFSLPHGWYRQAVEDAIVELQQLLEQPLRPDNAWIFLYCCVAWYEEKPKGSGRHYLHVNDRLASASGKSLATNAKAALLSHFPHGVNLREVVDQIGRRYALERVRQGFSATGWQRNNVTGNGMEAALQVVIGNVTGKWSSRTPRLNSLEGFELAPEGYHSRPDLALFSARDFRVLLSTKWTLRKERIGTYLHEAYFYKRRRPDLQVAFVVAEFNASIIRLASQ